MIWRVEIKTRPGVFDAYAQGIERDIHDLGFTSVTHVSVIQVFTIAGGINAAQITKIASQLLSDNITQEYSVCLLEEHVFLPSREKSHVVEIAYNPGVMDPVEESTRKGIRDFGITSETSVHTSKQFHLLGELTDSELNLIVEKVLSNKLIQHVVKDNSFIDLLSRDQASQDVCTVKLDILGASERQLRELSVQGQLFLNGQEMKAIQKYFKKLKRNPTDCELETIAQTWSEHCFHKTFRGNIDYTYISNGKKKTRRIKSLLKSTIMKVTQELNKPWCVSVFHDNAGVIEFDDQQNVCFKVETHNHPSALEPFGGANTGVGGVIRDILGTGLGAKPVCNTDVFCFASPDHPFDHLPQGALHPKRVMKGVVAGVKDYGNKMGIPTVNGAILFDERYVGNPLVYCGNIGMLPKGKERKKALKGDYILAVGGKTGCDGIHGATFSSGELTHESEVISSGAVQIGDPIQEKKVMDVLIQARDQDLYSAITDCGAGGFSSAVGEMGKDLGARVDLDTVPLKYAGLSYMEIWISESQERMVLSVPPKNLKRLLAIFSAENVEATVIGEFTGAGRLELFYKGVEVCNLDMDFLHEGNPKITKKARWLPFKSKKKNITCPHTLDDSLKKILSHYNVCSKEWVIRQYDHEVQGGSIIKPLGGLYCDGPSDASVVAPILGSQRGFAVANGINARYGMIDPYWMAGACIDEAIRQIISVGGNLKKIALLDNFCWGNPDKPDRLGGLVRCAEGCYKFAKGYGVPFISGKDSLYNEYAQGNKTIAIPGTILISAIGIIDDITKCVTFDFKKKGSLIYVVGLTKAELGGSIYYDICGALGDSVPKVDIKLGQKIFSSVAKAVGKKIVFSMHDCSEGGLAVALAEMAFGSGLGCEVFIEKVPFSGKGERDDHILFSESQSRFIVEVDPDNRGDFERLMKDVPLGLIGQVTDGDTLKVKGLDGNLIIRSKLSELKEAWQKPLRW